MNISDRLDREADHIVSYFAQNCCPDDVDRETEDWLLVRSGLAHLADKMEQEITNRGRKWRPNDFDSCPQCGNSLEALSYSDDPGEYLYDGDEVRCVECKTPGHWSCDSTGEEGYVRWDQD